MPQDEVNQQSDADMDDDIASLPEIRRIQDEGGAWYYNVTDVIAALTGTADASDYWVKMKRRGKSEERCKSCIWTADNDPPQRSLRHHAR